jgi:hypothetical protein
MAAFNRAEGGVLAEEDLADFSAEILASGQRDPDRRRRPPPRLLRDRLVGTAGA